MHRAVAMVSVMAHPELTRDLLGNGVLSKDWSGNRERSVTAGGTEHHLLQA